MTTPDEEVYQRRRAWERRHPNIKKFWATSVRSAVNAIKNPGGRFAVARIAFIQEGPFLHMELPSGRRIRYPYARLYADNGSTTFTFRDTGGGRWEWYHVLKHRRGAFGGLIAENATQALCRDVFVDAMLRLESAGYHVVAHLHDEFICEVPKGFGISTNSAPSSQRHRPGRKTCRSLPRSAPATGSARLSRQPKRATLTRRRSSKR